MLFSGVLNLLSARVSSSVSFQSAFLSFIHLFVQLINVSASAVYILGAKGINKRKSGTDPGVKELAIPWCFGNSEG